MKKGKTVKLNQKWTIVHAHFVQLCVKLSRKRKIIANHLNVIHSNSCSVYNFDDLEIKKVDGSFSGSAFVLFGKKIAHSYG